jgi:hypothetical protein
LGDAARVVVFHVEHCIGCLLVGRPRRIVTTRNYARATGPRAFTRQHYHPMETQEMSYTVTATSHIGPVKYSITTTIEADKVESTLAKGVLYDGQRIAASKAMKGLGKRGEISFSDEVEAAVHASLLEVFGDSAEITTSEYVKTAKADVKFVRAHAILDAIEMSGGDVKKLAVKVGYNGLDYEIRSEAFLRKITDYKP